LGDLVNGAGQKNDDNEGDEGVLDEALGKFWHFGHFEIKLGKFSTHGHLLNI
jgi:hypothetical protein